MQRSNFGGFAKEAGHAGARENPITWSHVEYKDGIDIQVENAIYRIVEENPELGLNSYNDTLEANGLKWSVESLRNADISEFDVKCLLALILASVRADRFCDGLLLSYLEDGIFLRWVGRIQALAANAEHSE